jgi:glycosyltransferase involved in cell wall biosynthesis
MYSNTEQFLETELTERFKKIFEVLEIPDDNENFLDYVDYLRSREAAELCLLFFSLTLYYPRESEFEDFQHSLITEDISVVVKRYFWSNIFAEFYRPESNYFCDVTETSRAPYNTGIQRVTRKIFKDKPDFVHGFAWDRERYAPKKLTTNEQNNLLNWGFDQDVTPIVRIGKMQYKSNLVTRIFSYFTRFTIARSIYHFLKSVINLDAYLVLSKLFPLESNHKFFVFYKAHVFTTELFYLDQELISIYINLIKNGSVVFTALVHDAIPVTYPQYVASPTVAGYVNILRLYSYSKKIYTPTLSEGREVRKALDFHGKGERLMEILPLSGDSFEETTPAIIDNRNPDVRILILGSLDPRKNQLRMLRAIRGVSDKVDRRIVVNIVAGGEWMSNSVRSELKLLRGEGIECILNISISDEELYRIFQTSSFLMFVSHAEGFGLPIAEAGVLNLPVITSNFGAMKEVALQYCRRFLLTESTSVEAITESLLSAIKGHWQEGLAPLRQRTWRDVSLDFYSDISQPKGKLH